jgi:dihydroorotate dehydrogenase electron transfer subunit
MYDMEGVIRENLLVCQDFYRCKIELARPMGKVIPGQFIMLKIPSAEVFLRRPFSIYDCGKQTVTILYKAVGKGTRALTSAGRKERVMVLGPLGHGFRVHQGYTPVLVAGGIGIAGLHLLWKQVKRKACFFYGCSTEQEVPLLGGIDFNTRGRTATGTRQTCGDLSSEHGQPGTPVIEPRVCTLDGSTGFYGNVVQLLESSLSLVGEKPYVYACGPQPMFASLKALLAEKEVPCQVLVEERMACGLGLCFGCVKKTLDEAEPYKRACVEGPVFDLWQLSL